MTQTLVQSLYLIIAILMMSLAACGWMLRKGKHKDRKPPVKAELLSEVTSEEKQKIAEAAVKFAIEQTAVEKDGPTSELQPSPVSPWQQALRATALHRRPVRR